MPIKISTTDEGRPNTTVSASEPQTFTPEGLQQLRDNLPLSTATQQAIDGVSQNLDSHSHTSDQIGANYTGKNYINNKGNQEEVNFALDQRIAEISDVINPEQPSITTIDAKDLRTTVPSGDGVRIVATNGVTYVSNGTDAGDWEVEVTRDALVLGDKSYRSGICENVSLHGKAFGMASAVVGGLPFVWGSRVTRGVVPSPSQSTGSIGRPHRFSYRQHATRSHPDYRPYEIGATDGINRIHFEHHDFGHLLTDSGLLYGWCFASSEIGHMMGTDGVSQLYDMAAPILFDDGTGSNTPIRDFFTSSFIGNGTEMYGGLYIGKDDSLWLMTNNYANLHFDNNIANTGTTEPTKITKNEWLGLTIKKVRASEGGRNYYVHLSDESLWACGINDQGEFGLGNTTNQEGWVQIASGVLDFDISKDSHASDNFTYYVDNSKNLYGAGHNGSGWQGQANTTSSNSWVLITTNVERVVSAGSGSHHAMGILKTDGLWYRVGENSRGCFGSGTTDDITALEVWSELNSLIAQNGALIDINMNQYWSHGITQICFIFQNGNIYISGEGSLGQLGDGKYSDSSVFVQAQYNTNQGEIPVGLGTAMDTGGNSHIYFRTNQGNIYMSGEDANGFSSGLDHNPDSNQGVFEKVDFINFSESNTSNTTDRAAILARYASEAYRDEAEQLRNEAEQFRNEAFSTTPSGTVGATLDNNFSGDNDFAGEVTAAEQNLNNDSALAPHAQLSREMFADRFSYSSYPLGLMTMVADGGRVFSAPPSVNKNGGSCNNPGENIYMDIQDEFATGSIPYVSTKLQDHNITFGFSIESTLTNGIQVYAYIGVHDEHLEAVIFDRGLRAIIGQDGGGVYCQIDYKRGGAGIDGYVKSYFSLGSASYRNSFEIRTQKTGVVEVWYRYRKDIPANKICELLGQDFSSYGATSNHNHLILGMRSDTYTDASNFNWSTRFTNAYSIW